MGRWSRHPMGSDGALDAKDGFMEDFDLIDEDIYFFERPKEEIRDELLKLSLDEIKEKAERYDYVADNRFAIPYTFIEYETYPTDPAIKEYLKECLDYHDDITGPWNYCNGEELAHIEYFKEHFDDIISGKMEYPGDEGLFAAIDKHLASGEGGLVNLTNE